MKTFDLATPLVDAVGLLLIGGLLLLQTRTRRVTLRRLWLLPVLVAGFTVVSVVRHRPASPWTWAWLALGLALGLGTGSVRSGLTRIRAVDRSSGVMLVKPSTVAVLIWLGAFVLRIVIRQVVGHRDPDPSTAGLVSAALLMASLGSVLANAVWMSVSYTGTPAAESGAGPASAPARAE